MSSADVKRLATLLHLQRRLRMASGCPELDFILVNESFNLVSYRQDALWFKNEGVQALSGLAVPEGNAPYVHWINNVMQHCVKANLTESKVLRPSLLPEHIRVQWDEWLPAEVLLLSLAARGHFSGGYLLLARDQPWKPAELSLLNELMQTWVHARALLEPVGCLSSLVRWLRSHHNTHSTKENSRQLGVKIKKTLRQPRIWILASLLAFMLMPVHLTVLAPAELVPRDPYIIRAPLDGVVEQIVVQPNQLVEQGEPLLVFERSAINNRLLIAQGVLNTVRTEYRQRAQQALTDTSSAAELAVLEGQFREKSIEINYLQDLLARGNVLSPKQGVVFLDDPLQWSGRPVVTGQRIMVVAEEKSVYLEAWLALGDAIILEPGSRVRLFLNAEPLTPVEAELEYVAFQAQEKPDGQYAYRVQARLLDEQSANVRVGLKGTAKLEGERVTMAYWIMRRPLASFRGWLGV